KYAHLLYGTKFTVYTDHKPLEHFLKQKSLSARQRRWLDQLSYFDFDISYVQGTANIIADALSRIYSDEPKGVIRAASEFVTDPDDPLKETAISDFLRQRTAKSRPLYTGDAIQTELEVFAVTRGQKATADKAVAEGRMEGTPAKRQNSKSASIPKPLARPDSNIEDEEIDDLPVESEEELILDGESERSDDEGMVVVQRPKEPNETMNPIQEQAQQPENPSNISTFPLR
ncbi:16962_t:CDS:1, partial [Acaulospora colombiana]